MTAIDMHRAGIPVPSNPSMAASKRLLPRVRRVVALGLLAAAACCPMLAGAQAEPRSPGSGFVDPAGLPPRTAPNDVEPVWRGPSPDTLATVRRRGVLRVGVVTVEPMVMRDPKGELVGYSIDLARKLAQDIGVEVEFVPTSWTFVMPDLLSRQFDLVATGLWVTVPRALVVNFTEPTVSEGIHLVANRAKAGTMKSRADFDQPGVTLSVFGGTMQEQLARRLFPRATLLRVNDDEVAPVALGVAHAALVPTLAPQSLLRGMPDRLFLPLEQPLASTPAALAVRKGDPDFLSFLNTWLVLHREEGWLAERALHWAGARAGAK